MQNLQQQLKSNITLQGKSLITTQYWSKDELDLVLQVATEMKRHRYDSTWQKVLAYKTFLMLFYNPSVRTRISFEAAATELGGHAQFLTPEMTKLKTEAKEGESIEDAAQTISRYATGMGHRMAEGAVPKYGAGNDNLLEYIKYATIPIINMANDKFHPCQGFADLLGWAEWLGGGIKNPDFNTLKGKKLLITWTRGKMARTWSSVQESMLIASRYGMNVTLARPDGYDLDPEIYQWTRENCHDNGAKFDIVDDPDSGYAGADVVYSRNWMSMDAYQNGELQTAHEIEKALSHQNWITNEERMLKTPNAIYTHCMPIARGNEVTDAVASGSRSAIYDVAENRLHVQKAIMALTMADLSNIKL